jgi:uncharacterized damage-inducible protein DinB
MTRSILADAFDYHVWASVRLIDACASLGPDQLTSGVPGTYGSIIDTIRHLVGADRSYLALLSAGAVREIEEAELGLSELRAAMAANAVPWAALVARQLDPDAIVVRHRADGTESHAPLGIRLAQALHHGSDHRSQVCTALTALGIEPPAIDAWDFAESDGRLAEVPAGT